jgi:hypothetical protein
LPFKWLKVPRSALPASDVITKRNILFAQSDNFETTLNELANDALYAPLESVGSFMKVRNGSGYVKITNTGSSGDDFELDLSGSVTSNVTAGTSGVH